MDETLLCLVDWPPVYDTLTGGQPVPQEATVQPAHRAAVRLAHAVIRSPRGRVKWALAEATPAGMGLADLDQITGWLRSTAHVVDRWALAQAAPAEAVARARPVAAPGRLVMDERLPALPLVPLARDIARTSGGLTVEMRDLGAVNGRYQRAERLICLNPGSDDLERTWAHELAHALDTDRDDTDQAERFAVELGRLLLVHQPAGVQQAEPYVAQINRLVGPRRTWTGGLPADIWESWAAFLTLPLLAKAQAN